jgi:hypothetical protein
MQLKLRILLLFIIIVAFNLSCKQDKVTDNEEIVVHIPDEFVDFHEKFHKDSTFQINHIIFPLSGKLGSQGEIIFWSKENWVLHKEFDSSFSNYKRDYTVLDDLVIEKIFDNLNTFSMERRFAKVLGEWNLIYYNVVYKNPGLEIDTTE